MATSGLSVLCVCTILLAQVSNTSNSRTTRPEYITNSSGMDPPSYGTVMQLSYNESHDNLTYDLYCESGYDVGLGVFISFMLISVSGNVMNFVVWSAESSFNPTIFFMKALAVSDSVYVMTVVLVETMGLIGAGPALRFCCLFLGAHTTLAVVFSRWMAVRRPLACASLLTRRRVVVAYWATLLWSVLGAGFFSAILLFPVFSGAGRAETVAAFAVLVGAWAVLPAAAIVVLNASLAYMVRVHRTSMRQQQQQQRQRAQEQRTEQFHRLLAAVVCLSVTTVLTFPAGVTIEGLLEINERTSYFRIACKDLLKLAAFSLQLFNASINVVYYLAFASQFRQLLRHRARSCLCCKKGNKYGDTATHSAPTAPTGHS